MADYDTVTNQIPQVYPLVSSAPWLGTHRGLIFSTLEESHSGRKNAVYPNRASWVRFALHGLKIQKVYIIPSPTLSFFHIPQKPLFSFMLFIY